MPGQLSKSLKNTRSRRTNPPVNRPQPSSAILVTNASSNVAVLTITFNQPVSLAGTPAFTTDVAGATPVSAVQSGPDEIAITFSASIAAATALNVGYRDPAVRNSSGGFVTSTSVAI